MQDLKTLRKILTELYSDTNLIKMIVSDLGVQYDESIFGTDTEANWFAMLNEIQKQGKLNDLIKAVIERSPHEDRLKDFLPSVPSDNPTIEAEAATRQYMDVEEMINKELIFDMQKMRSLLEKGNQKAVIKKLSIYAKALTDTYQTSILGLSRRWNEFEQERASGIMTKEEVRVNKAVLSRDITYFIDKLDEEKDVMDMLESLDGSSLLDPSSKSVALEVPTIQYEKVMGGRNDIVGIEWLDAAKIAAKSICKTLHSSNKNGTGWIYQGKYLFTNNHVIATKQEALETKLLFNYQKDSDTIELSLDPDQGFVTNRELDYACIRIKENPALAQFGTLEIEDHLIPKIKDLVSIIQHPQGKPKMIAMPDEVISVWPEKNYLFYLADTEGGSSGAPVFNQDWKVIALHHGGLLKKDGGVVINANGDNVESNRGSLMSSILKNIKDQGFTI